MAAFFRLLSTSVCVLLAASIVDAAPASFVSVTSSLVARQGATAPGIVGSIPQIPPQCQSLCGAVVNQAVGCGPNLACLCTDDIVDRAVACDGCTVVALNRQLAQFQASFDQAVATCRAAGFNVKSATIVPNTAAGLASAAPGSSSGAPGSAAPGSAAPGSATPGSSGAPGSAAPAPGASGAPPPPAGGAPNSPSGPAASGAPPLPAGASGPSGAPAAATPGGGAAAAPPPSPSAAGDNKNGAVERRAGAVGVVAGTLALVAALL